MIPIDISPYIIEAPFRVAWYGVLAVGGPILGLFLALKMARQYGIDPSQVLSLFGAAIPGGLIGARLFHLICQFDFYLAHPGLIPQIWLGGFSQYGMILGGLASAAIYAHWQKLPFLRFLDLIPVPVLIGLSIGRIGCITRGCCHGGPTDLPWSFVFVHPDSWIAPALRNVPVHPTQLYEIVWFLALAGILLGLRKYLRPVEGLSSLVFFMGHAAGRFLIFFTRYDHQALQRMAGLTQAQIIALVISLISISLLIVYHKRIRAKIGQRNHISPAPTLESVP